jgi:hypothetical protein
MLLTLKPSETTRDCKLKRVYARLPLRVHSAATIRVAAGGPGNRLRLEPEANRPLPAAGWSCNGPRLRVLSEPSSDACRRPIWDRSGVVDVRAGALGVA